MSTDVTLPALGESVTEGTVTRWLKQVGDSIAVDEPLLEVSTDKVDTEIPSPVEGTVIEIKVAEDETVEVGTVLATVGADAAADAGGGESAPAADQAGQQSPPAQPAQPAATPPPTAGAIAAEEDGKPAPASAASPEAESPASTETPTPAEPPAEPAPAAQTANGQGTDVRLPELGESVTEGTVTRWLKQVGDSVALDEPLLEISTDKVDTEIPSPVAGTVLDIKVAEDETVEVGAVLAVVGAGEGAPAEATAPTSPATSDAPAAVPGEPASAAPAS